MVYKTRWVQGDTEIYERKGKKNWKNYSQIWRKKDIFLKIRQAISKELYIRCFRSILSFFNENILLS